MEDATLDFKDSEKKTWALTSWSLHSNNVIPLPQICQWLPFAHGIVISLFCPSEDMSEVTLSGLIS